MKQTQKLTVVAGPTASGKTAVAIALAKAYNGEIISADSMQVYRHMSIATAAPTPAEQNAAIHHLIEFLEPSEPFSVAQYATLARKQIGEIAQRGKLPILAGGTGLYINAVINNIDYSEIQSDEALRQSLLDKAQLYGGQALHDELRKIDPEIALTIHPNNIPRLVRAIEVYQTTGITMTQHQINSRKQPPNYDLTMIGLNYRDRQKLYDRINRRVDQMMENGLLQEAEAFLSRPDSKTAFQAIGYKELAPYFSGQSSLEEALDRIKQESRRYAKRQLTWFRKDTRFNWFYIDDYSSFESLVQAIRKRIDYEVRE